MTAVNKDQFKLQLDHGKTSLKRIRKIRQKLLKNHNRLKNLMKLRMMVVSCFVLTMIRILKSQRQKLRFKNLKRKLQDKLREKKEKQKELQRSKQIRKNSSYKKSWRKRKHKRPRRTK